MARLLTNIERKVLKAAVADEGTRREDSAIEVGKSIGWEKMTYAQYELVKKDYAYWARHPDWDYNGPNMPGNLIEPGRIGPTFEGREALSEDALLRRSFRAICGAMPQLFWKLVVPILIILIGLWLGHMFGEVGLDGEV